MNTTPIYCRDARYAKEHDEVELLRESDAANLHCRAAIEQAITRNFDGWHLKPGCLDEVLEQFPLERVTFVLSATVDVKNFDGRFSRENKAWAHDKQLREWLPYHNEPVAYDPRDSFVVGTHPAILDGFVNLARKAADKAAVDELLARLTGLLHLQDHTITFHIIDDEIGSGMIMESEDLQESDAFNAIADRLYDQPFIEISDVTTYQLGSGESDHADCAEIAALVDAYTCCPKEFDRLLADHAEVIASLHDLNVANPAYDEDELDNE